MGRIDRDCGRIWVVLGGVGEAGQLSLTGVAFEPLCGGSPRGGRRDGGIRARDSINDVDFRAYIFTKHG